MPKEGKSIEFNKKLVNKCQKNNRRAQMELYKLYYKAMYNTSLRITGNQTEAEDAMQEGFLNAFMNISKFDYSVSFGAWLKKIIINKSIDKVKYKKIQFEQIESKEYKLANEEEQDNDIEETITNIKKAINKLPEGYRVILSLKLLEGYDHEEISEILNISSSTSRSQYTRAKSKLKDILKSK